MQDRVFRRIDALWGGGGGWTGGIFYFPWHRHQIDFIVSSERPWQSGVNGIVKIPKRSCRSRCRTQPVTVRSPVQANALLPTRPQGSPIPCQRNMIKICHDVCLLPLLKCYYFIILIDCKINIEAYDVTLSMDY